MITDKKLDMCLSKYILAPLSASFAAKSLSLMTTVVSFTEAPPP